MAGQERFQEVLAAARDGADWAWAELYRESAPTLLRFITSLGAAEPEDCLGECFVQAVRNLKNFTGDEAAFRAWMFRVARNRVVDTWRASSRRPAYATGDVDARHERAFHSDAADTRLLDRSAAGEVLAELPETQRAVLVLRVLEGFTVEETATILERSPGSVRVLQSRALKRLRQVLAARP